MNMNKWVLSLRIPSFVFNFNPRKRKQTLIVFYLLYKLNVKNKQVKYLLFKK